MLKRISRRELKTQSVQDHTQSRTQTLYNMLGMIADGKSFENDDNKKSAGKYIDKFLMLNVPSVNHFNNANITSHHMYVKDNDI